MIDIGDILLYLTMYGMMFFITGYLRKRVNFFPNWLAVMVRFISGLCFGIWVIRLISEIVNSSV